MLERPRTQIYPPPEFQKAPNEFSWPCYATTVVILGSFILLSLGPQWFLSLIFNFYQPAGAKLITRRLVARHVLGKITQSVLQLNNKSHSFPILFDLSNPKFLFSNLWQWKLGSGALWGVRGGCMVGVSMPVHEPVTAHTS